MKVRRKRRSRKVKSQKINYIMTPFFTTIDKVSAWPESSSHRLSLQMPTDFSSLGMNEQLTPDS